MSSHTKNSSSTKDTSCIAQSKNRARPGTRAAPLVCCLCARAHANYSSTNTPSYCPRHARLRQYPASTTGTVFPPTWRRRASVMSPPSAQWIPPRKRCEQAAQTSAELSPSAASARFNSDGHKPRRAKHSIAAVRPDLMPRSHALVHRTRARNRATLSVNVHQLAGESVIPGIV